MIAMALIRGRGFPMLAEEPEHCGVSIAVTVGALWRARTEIERLKKRLERPVRMIRRASGESRVRFAYADPPYLGQGSKHYGHQHAEASEWDTLPAHAALIRRLCDEFPEAWALSLSVPSLYDILPLCPRDVRVAAWVKPFASFKPGVNPAYCWEPVIFWGGRSASERGGRKAPTVRDYVSASITTKRGTSGAKPEAFCFWLFEFLGVNGGDEFADIFPGSGAVSRAWRTYALHNPERAA